MKNVTIYTTPTCGFCKMTKAFFQENKVAYTEHNVVEDVAARTKMIELTGQTGVPVIEIDGETVIGFDKPRLKELLGL